MHFGGGPGGRSCFVHVGTHKTGTTAIQRFFAANREGLAAAGLVYPHSGVLSAAFPGHHNVAFELAGDERFDPALGTLADVTRELARAPADACLSSEVFQYLHADHAGLVTLRDALAASGYRGRGVLYVRAQDDYLESLYAELVKHGLQLPFADVLGALMERAVVRHDRVWAFRFDYTTLADRFAAVFGPEAVVVRHYRPGGPADTIVRDFLGAIALPSAAAALGGAPAAYENVRLTTGGVIAHLFRNTAAALHDDRVAAAGAELVARYPREAAEPFRPLAPVDRTRVAARFTDDNALLARRWPAAAGIAQRGPAELETERARAARQLFEFAEASRRTYTYAAGRRDSAPGA